MKKIGIVTYYKNNYGSCLQAFALSEVLKKLGYQPEIIQYEQNLVKKLVKDVYYNMNIVLNKKYFDTLKILGNWNKKHLKTSKIYYGTNALKNKCANEYDLFICGSDQVWNSKKSGIIPFYYLDFVDSNKKMSYAPSLGKNEIELENKEQIKELLNTFKHISVREESSSEYLKKEFNIESKPVLDPTLILEQDVWKNIITKNTKKVNKKEKYVFMYLLTKNDEYKKKVEDFAKKRNLKVKEIAILKDDKSATETADQFEFVNMIKNAEFVFTDSFHGLIFSVIFEKQFLSFKRFADTNTQSQNMRIYNIMNIFGLEDRLINADTIEEISNKNIDYDKVNSILKEKRQDSINYLKESIEDLLNEKK